MRKYGLILLIFTLLTVLFGCGTDKGEIFDSEIEIAKEGDSYTFVRKIGSESKTKINYRFKKFSGVKTQWLIEAKNHSEIKLRYDTEIDEGEFKIVIVTPQQEVLHIDKNTSKGSYQLKTSNGKYRIKIVGRNAKGKIKMVLDTKGVKRVSHPDDD